MRKKKETQQDIKKYFIQDLGQLVWRWCDMQTNNITHNSLIPTLLVFGLYILQQLWFHCVWN